jgi:adenine-specific DNA-methyltransferase
MTDDVAALRRELDRLRLQIKKQRYGLVWLDVPEAFEAETENKIPTLTFDSELSIPGTSDKPSHVLIEGDNYHALTCLNYTHQSSVDLIYIDPPYNTGQDGFRYKDKRVLETYPDGELIEKSHPLRHSAWLSFMDKRLRLAKNLLTQDGAIFVSIDDNEYARLILLMEEIFGEDNIKTIVVKMSEATGVKMAHVAKVGQIPKLKEYLVIAKKDGVKNLHLDKLPKESWDNEYKQFLVTPSDDELALIKEIKDDENRTEEDVKRLEDIVSNWVFIPLSTAMTEAGIPSGDKAAQNSFKYENSHRIFRTASLEGGAKTLALDKKRSFDVAPNFFLITTPQKKAYLIDGSVNAETASPRSKVLFADEYLTIHPGDFWSDIKTTGLENEGGVSFKNGKKPLKLVERVLKTNNRNDITVLDFFAGSGTTGEAVLRLNESDGGRRKFILVNVASEKGKDATTHVMRDVCLQRMKNLREQADFSAAFYTTTFVGDNNVLNATDEDRIELAKAANGLLALAESTLSEVTSNDFYSIFQNETGAKLTAIYFREELDKFEDFVEKVNSLNSQTTIYKFSWGATSDYADEFVGKNIQVKVIPQPILEIYRRIYSIGAQ